MPRLRPQDQEPDHSGTYLCSQCYDLAGLDNQVNDDCREITPDEIVERDRLLREIVDKGGDVEGVKRCCSFLWRAS